MYHVQHPKKRIGSCECVLNTFQIPNTVLSTTVASISSYSVPQSPSIGKVLSEWLPQIKEKYLDALAIRLNDLKHKPAYLELHLLLKED